MADIGSHVHGPPVREARDDRPQKMRAPASRRAEEVDNSFSAHARRQFAQGLQCLGVRTGDEVVEGRVGVGSKVEDELFHRERKGGVADAKRA